MKAISLWQPWATLVACGAKRFETRSWEPNFRGELAIHAAQKWTGELNALCDTELFRSTLEAAGHFATVDSRGRRRWSLPFGIVAVTRLTTVFQIGRRGGRVVLSNSVASKLPEAKEITFGDYAPGRYAWQLDDLRPLPQPLLVAGRQGLFEVLDSLVYPALKEKPPAEPSLF